MNKSRRISGLIAALAMCLLAVVGSTVAPAYADKSGPAGTAAQQPIQRSAKFTISADDVRALQQATIKPAGGKSTAGTPQPACPGEWVKLAGWVEWWYDPVTRQTVSSADDWGGSVTCTGMSYISATSALYFRNKLVQFGSSNSCGEVGTSSDECGSVPTSGEWACAGIGNCNGLYYHTIGLRVDLPAGWLWSTVPSKCDIEFGGVSMLCVFDTTGVVVPPVN
jgi:hypothetical protein